MLRNAFSQTDQEETGIRAHLDRQIGLRMRSARERAGISQAQLGKAVRVSFQQIQKYEAAVTPVSASLLFQIANVLNVDVPYFFGELRSGDMQH